MNSYEHLWITNFNIYSYLLIYLLIYLVPYGAAKRLRRGLPRGKWDSFLVSQRARPAIGQLLMLLGSS